MTLHSAHTKVEGFEFDLKSARMAESIAKKQSYLSARVQQHRAGAGAGFGAGDGAGAGASNIVQCDTASPVEGVPAIGGSWLNMMRAVPGDHVITAQDEMD